MVDLKDYECLYENKWCPGCGNFGILRAMKDALVTLQLPPSKILIVSGIGQAAKTPEFLTCNMFHGLHGRALPVATGAKIANHELTILINSGDGDCYGEGGNHFLSAIRRNIDVTLLVHNNKVYGLTKGQASPTSDMDMVTKSQPMGVIQEPFNPLMVAIAMRAGFVARGFSDNIKHLSLLIQKGIKHKGFSLIDILQPCVSFNRINTHEWYRNRVYDLEDDGHDPRNFEEAIQKAQIWGDKIPVGIFFTAEKASFIDRIKALRDGPLLKRSHPSDKLRELISQW